jgi:cysteine-rich repeat protein
VLNVPQATAMLAGARARAGASAQDAAVAAMTASTHVLAAVSAGVCTTTGNACALDRDCEDASGQSGTCFVPPGGCIRDLGTRCNPTFEGSCPMGQFCQPSGVPREGTCRAVERTCHGGSSAGNVCSADSDCPGGTCTERCAETSDCRAGAQCNDAGQDFQRLVDPLLKSEDGGGTTVLIGAGRCVEDLMVSCTSPRDCGPGEFCAGGSCRREQGVCRRCDASDAACTACPPRSTCQQDLVVQTAVDSDGDEIPDAVDVCPAVQNPAQEDLDGDGIGDACGRLTCGDGILQPGETCDDGNANPDDGCDCTSLCPAAVGGAIEQPRLALSRLGPPAGDEKLVLTGRIRLDQSVTADLATLIAGGLQIVVVDDGRGGVAVFDLSRHAAPVPGPSSAGDCEAAQDGWSIAGHGRAATYTNGSNRLPGASCAPGSAQGLRRIELADRRTTAGTVDFRVIAQRVSIAAPAGPLRTTIVFGTTDADSAAGRCGVNGFPASQCTIGGSGRRLSCRGG